MNGNAFEMIWHCLKGRPWSNHALRVSPAVTRLTVHRRLQVPAPADPGSLGPFRDFAEFFQKILIFLVLATTLEILYISSMLLLKCM